MKNVHYYDGDLERVAASRHSHPILIAALAALDLHWDDAPTPGQEISIRAWIKQHIDDKEFDVITQDDGRRFVWWGNYRFYL
jgi:hypothetical protein